MLFPAENIRYDAADIERRRAEIGDRFKSESENIKSDIVRKISSADLKLLFKLYNEVFFNGMLNAYRGTLKFSVSSRLSRSAGKTFFPGNIALLKPEQMTAEIRLGAQFFLKYDETNHEKSVGGVVARNGLEALQLVFEHELCHFIEFINYHESSCRKKRFKNMAMSIFGHTESTHRLPTGRQIAAEKYRINIGDAVVFNFGSKKMTGIVNNINKRATVMVKDKKGIYRDRKGNLYSKYYVPLESLTPCKI